MKGSDIRKEEVKFMDKRKKKINNKLMNKNVVTDNKKKKIEIGRIKMEALANDAFFMSENAFYWRFHFSSSHHFSIFIFHKFIFMCRIVITRRNQNVIIFLYMLHHSSTSFHACHQIYSNLIELWSWAWEFKFDLLHGVRFLFYFGGLGWNWNFFVESLNPA